ncbi:hypothetical protein M5K25_011553 [Dendrobium thyrsiflorum]|uniref:Uncharacterized protein n=1 Tax=Dendrobium thyrsiflorum TaxID=117978 RepID=A0ABD0V3H6_DENTH
MQPVGHFHFHNHFNERAKSGAAMLIVVVGSDPSGAISRRSLIRARREAPHASLLSIFLSNSIFPPHDSSSHLANRQILSPASPPVDASLNSRADHASPSLDAPAARISHLFSSPGVVHDQLADTGLLSSRLRADDLLPSEAPPTLPVLSSICLKISCHAYWTRSDLTQGIYVEVKNVCLADCINDIIFLETSTLVLLSVSPSPVGELKDEHLASTCKDHRRLNGDHLHSLVSLHYLLDTS